MKKFKGGPEVKVPKLEVVKLLTLVRQLAVALELELSAGEELLRVLLAATIDGLFGAGEQLALAHRILWGTQESLPSLTVRPPAYGEMLSAYAKPWRLLRTVLNVWIEMTDTPDPELVVLSEALEGTQGMSFLRGDEAASTWTHGDSKLKLLRDAHAERLFRARDMAALWESLVAAHDRFGEESGATRIAVASDRIKQTPEEARAAVDALLGLYVLQVCATERYGDDASARRAERLLAPYIQAVEGVEEKKAELRSARLLAVAKKKEATKPADQGEATKPAGDTAPPSTNVRLLRPSQRPAGEPASATGT